MSDREASRRGLLQAGIAGMALLGLTAAASAEGKKPRVFELRTYVAHPGRLDALHARFRHHTAGLFAKHGMVNVGYWVPQQQRAEESKLIYLLGHESREAAAASWKAFREDPAWVTARTASEKDGPLVKSVESIYLDPTDYSALK